MSAQDEHGGDLPREEGNKTYFPVLGCNHCPAAFYNNENHDKHQVERHPDKPVRESWESSPGHTVTYVPNFNRHTPHLYVLSGESEGKHLSPLAVGHEGELDAINTHSKHRREGHATELLNAAKEHSENTPGVPAPKLSSTRTAQGDKFQKAAAKKLGGKAPTGGSLLSPRQMMGMLDLESQ